MTLIVGFLVAHMGAILGGLMGASGVIFGMFRHQQAKAATAAAGEQVAQANQKVADNQNAEAQANAAAAQAGAKAVSGASNAQSDVDALPDGGAASELLNEWSRPGEDAGRGGSAGGGNPNAGH
ncbi:hypothetical protein [Paraburkholderia bannensis]|uniref:hypothetical protein n=1 Tax=Paraburkholderia bannensis TaxID=765414 RepID=UPI000B174FE2|nr:hypothetical protein [Paraburkholderia bannensis]